MEGGSKDQELQQMMRLEQIRELSSEEQNNREEAVSRSSYRKPLKNGYSDEEHSSSEDSPEKGNIPLPPKPPKQKSALQQAQQQMRWTREQTSELDTLSKLQGNGMKDKKIRELANKCKTLNIAYEKQKTIRRGLEQQLAASTKAVIETRKNQQESRVSLEKTNISRVEGMGKCNNCSEMEKKIMQMRLKIQSSKSQLNKAQRLITREIGQGVDIDKALAQEGGWKGRQQKIEKLKGRVHQLEQKLATNGVNVSHMSGFSQVTQTKVEFNATQRTSTLADNKRKQLQNLKIQVETLRSDNDLLQGKVKSLNSRKLTLQSQIKELKSEFEKKKQIFVQKSENDDRFIALLKQQNDKLKKDERVVTKVVYKQAKENTQEVEALKKQLQNQRRKVKQLLRLNQQLQTQQQTQSQPQKTTETRAISAQRRKQLEQQYLNNNTKYLKNLSVQDQGQIYRRWKQSKKL